MSLVSLAQKKTIGTGLAELAKKPIGKTDLGTLAGLRAEAEKAGLGAEARAIAEPTAKLSFLQRLGKGLGAFNPAEAILTGTEKGVLAGVGKYVSGIATGVGSFITGRDIEGERRTFADIAEKMGIENGILKFGIGFVGDVLLDPSTYFGGAIAKGIIGTTKGVASLALKGVGKVVPEVETGLRMAGTGLQDALGRAFGYGYKSSKGAKEDVLTLLSKQQRAKLGLAASNLDRLGTGVLTQSQREELALKMIAGKRAEFIAREAGVSNLVKDKVVQIIDEKTGEKIFQSIPENQFEAINKVIDGTESGIAGKSVGGKIYHITAKTREQMLREGFKDGGEASIANLTTKSTDPVVQKAIEEQIARSQKMGEQLGLENPYEVYFPFIKKDKLEKFLNESKGIKVGSEGYRKQFKNLLTNENMELDPAKAFFTREEQIVSDRIIRNGLNNFVKKYGKGLDEFKSVDDALKNDFVLIKEKGNFGKELGYVSKYDGALIRDSISPEFQTISMLAKATGFDAVTSLFKRAVTGLFAPFHVRNFVSGQIQNFEVLGVGALNPKNIAIGQKIAYLMGKGEKLPSNLIEVAGKQMKFSDVMKPFVDRFSGDTFYNADFAMALKNGEELKQVAGIISKQRIKETIKTAGLGTEAIPFKIARGVGQFIEHQQKATAYITALGQGKNIDEALRLAEAAGFDYRALTRFESQIMRRIIPFYSFTRKNIELQLKTLGENPQRINQVLKFFENLSEIGGLTEEERGGLPDYLKDVLAVSFGKNKLGQLQVAAGFGTPIEQPGGIIGKGIADTIRKIGATLNPIIKVPLEQAFGKDFFQDRPVKEIVDAKQYQILPDFLKEFIGFREIQKKDKNGKTYAAYTADPEKLHILRNLPTSRLFSYLYEIYRPDTDTGARVLNLATGVKPKPIDLETVAYFRNKDKQRELEDLLIRAGVLKEFTKTYVPKKK